LKAELQAIDTPVIGRLRNEGGNTVVYAVGGRVSDAGSPSGYIVERRRIANPAQTQQTMALLEGLIGGQASIVIGNADGSTWTNLAQPVGGPPIETSSTTGLLDYQRPGMRRTLARAAPIPPTPWQVVVEFPRDAVLAPAERLVRGSALIALVLLTIATIVGWILSRKLTTPLRQVTEAAEAVAESRPAVRIDLGRRDELGRLAESFNTMAEKVEHARAELEHRVEVRTAELSTANRELEAFSYSVSHDLRAPVRAISGFVQILEEDHSDKLDADGRRSLERVKVNARRMGQLIDDLLAFSQIGRTPMVRQRVDMAQLARSVVDEAVRTAAPRTIDFMVDTLPPAFAEPSLINQVLVNLVANAVKFTGKRQYASIMIGARPDANGATAYFVRDNGAGFDMRHADKLFGVFQRLHKPEDFEGTGVGLAIIDRVVTRHGGRVWAEGRVNEGATFYFTLPGVP
jgi:signal transduction histidine kinase